MKQQFNDLESDCSDEIDEEQVAKEKREEELRMQKEKLIRCTQFEEIETNSFDNVDGGYDEPTVVGEDLAQLQNELD